MKVIILTFVIFYVTFSTQVLSFDHERPSDVTDGRFTVISSAKIRQGKPYNIHIRGFSLRRTIRLTIRINGTSDEGHAVNIIRNVEISRDRSRASLSIDTSGITKGTYSLVVRGGNVLEKRTLIYDTNKYSILVLLNKEQYLPGDLLLYKVFVVDTETYPVNPGCSCSVLISDPKKNTVSEVKDIKFRNGRYSGKLQLSSKVNLGVYSIRVKCDDDSINKNFEVKEFTSSVVKVRLYFEPKVLFSAGKFPITVEALYAFGYPATGTAVVTISNSLVTYKKNVTIVDENVTFEVDLVKDLLVDPRTEPLFTVSIIFNDNFMQTATDTAELSIIKFIYTFERVLFKTYEPGKEFSFTVTLRNEIDGTPAPAGTVVEIVPEAPKTIPPFNITLNETGQATSSVLIPDGFNEILELSLRAKDAIQEVLSASLKGSDFKSFIYVKVLNIRPSLEDRIRVRITTGTPVPFVMVHVIAKGILLRSTRVWFDEDSNEEKTVIYSFSVSLDYFPACTVVAYYISEGGSFEIGQDTVILNSNLNDYLKIRQKNVSVKPGAEIELEIDSKQYSTVSLVALDRRYPINKRITLKEEFLNGLNIDANPAIYDWKNVAIYERVFGELGIYVVTNIPRPRGGLEGSIADNTRGFTNNAVEPNPVGFGYSETSFLWIDVDIEHSACTKDDSDYCNKGIETIREQVPDSLTSYVIYGISMSEYDGLELSDDFTTFSVFKPFSISAIFPYSLQRNAVHVQDIIIFNYLKSAQNVDVKIKKSSKFDGVSLARYGWKDIDGFYVQTIATKPGKSVILKFALRPKVLGFILFEVTANGPLACDKITKQLRIIPEGIPRSITVPTLILSSSNFTQVNESLSCRLPRSAYLDTVEVTATVTRDIVQKEFHNLIYYPFLLGEQIILGFAPDVTIYTYLLATKKLTLAIRENLVKQITIGYKQALQYQRSDGSFSNVGFRGRTGSTFLTAFVVKHFYLAKHIINIDSNVIKAGADFIASQQQKDGSFFEPGEVDHPEFQRESKIGIGLAAYCSILFSLILPNYPEFEIVKDNSVKFLETAFNSNTSTYELSLIAYALRRGGSSKANEAAQIFRSRKPPGDQIPPWFTPGPPYAKYWDVETTSYGILEYIESKMVVHKLVDVVRYLISESNKIGAYPLSRDTAIAYEALNEFAAFASKSSFELKLSPNSGRSITTTADFTIKSFNLNQNVRRIDVRATFKDPGFAVVNLICNFYEDPKKIVPAYEVTNKYEKACLRSITFEACARYIPFASSGLTIMVVTLPLGFSAFQEVTHPLIRRIEFTENSSAATIYLDYVPFETICLNFTASKGFYSTTPSTSGTIEVYNYYDSSKRGSTSLPLPNNISEC